MQQLLTQVKPFDGHEGDTGPILVFEVPTRNWERRGELILPSGFGRSPVLTKVNISDHMVDEEWRRISMKT